MTKVCIKSCATCRPDAVDQDYSTTHLNQAHGKFCSLRHLAEPLHADVSGRYVKNASLLYRGHHILPPGF